ncbi:UNVERIFIED_CONTAM: hypothetical protein FKN15_062741 [Acipenser sinensis]
MVTSPSQCVLATESGHEGGSRGSTSPSCSVADSFLFWGSGPKAAAGVNITLGGVVEASPGDSDLATLGAGKVASPGNGEVASPGNDKLAAIGGGDGGSAALGIAGSEALGIAGLAALDSAGQATQAVQDRQPQTMWERAGGVSL